MRLATEMCLIDLLCLQHLRHEGTHERSVLIKQGKLTGSSHIETSTVSPKHYLTVHHSVS